MGLAGTKASIEAGEICDISMGFVMQRGGCRRNPPRPVRDKDGVHNSPTSTRLVHANESKAQACKATGGSERGVRRPEGRGGRGGAPGQGEPGAEASSVLEEGGKRVDGGGGVGGAGPREAGMCAVAARESERANFLQTELFAAKTSCKQFSLAW